MEHLIPSSLLSGTDDCGHLGHRFDTFSESDSVYGKYYSNISSTNQSLVSQCHSQWKLFLIYFVFRCNNISRTKICKSVGPTIVCSFEVFAWSNLKVD